MTRYKIVEIDPNDVYYESREHILGALVEPVDYLSHFEGETLWMQGVLTYCGRKKIHYRYRDFEDEVVYNKGDEFYFYRVRLKEVK